MSDFLFLIDEDDVLNFADKKKHYVFNKIFLASNSVAQWASNKAFDAYNRRMVRKGLWKD
jgi:hypothetical protein